MKSLFSRIPDVICSKNPCLSAKCWDVRYQCVVDLECRPIFIGIDKRSIPLGCLGNFNLNRTFEGSVAQWLIRALALRSGDPGFRTRSDHSLNLFLVVPGSTS